MKEYEVGGGCHTPIWKEGEQGTRNTYWGELYPTEEQSAKTFG